MFDAKINVDLQGVQLKVDYFDHMLQSSFLKGGFCYTTEIIP